MKSYGLNAFVFLIAIALIVTTSAFVLSYIETPALTTASPENNAMNNYVSVIVSNNAALNSPYEYDYDYSKDRLTLKIEHNAPEMNFEHSNPDYMLYMRDMGMGSL